MALKLSFIGVDYKLVFEFLTMDVDYKSTAQGPQLQIRTNDVEMAVIINHGRERQGFFSPNVKTDSPGCWVF
ncbi:hypothetical protein DRW42_26680 [Pedobacter miscanthi]|uniref:Uncharacterized protein n=1 Tax=Pedobacter miscanthi TaxID=2259170 RepID=A0A366KL91_9SPHI|nr:hypothetical protein DRW42_26680 [Pedobacter miscanthi]